MTKTSPDTYQTEVRQRRAVRKAVARSRILAAARTLFETRGYDAATVRDITGAIGLSTGSLFAHFAGKEDIYLELYGHKPLTSEQARALLRRLPVAEIHAAIAAGEITFDQGFAHHKMKSTIDAVFISEDLTMRN